MKQKHLDFSTYKKNILKNPEVKLEYDLFQPEFALIEAVLKARKEKGLTQKDLARKMKTKQSVISRLETGRANPSFSFLKKLAGALDSRFEIRFFPE
jgi:ribosome-binding protein aMBF1 (putative translation factor)